MTSKIFILLAALFANNLFAASAPNNVAETLSKYANNPKEWSALNYAIELEDFESALILVDYVINLNQVDQGHNALSRIFENASKNKRITLDDLQVALIKKLIQKGIDVRENKNHTQSPLTRAVQFGCEDVVKLILSKNVETEEDDCIYTAVRMKNYNIIEMLLKVGANINGKHLTPLACAITSGDIKMVHFLLSHGANPNTSLGFFESLDGETSLLGLALKNNHPDIVELLLQHDAKLR